MLLLHDVGIDPLRAATVVHKRQLPDDITTFAGTPAHKRWRLGGDARDGDGDGEAADDDGLVLPLILVGGGNDGGKEEDADSTIRSGDEDADAGPIPCPPRLALDMGSAYVPKEAGEHPLGEDAHFLIASRNAFGIADGVGGWTGHGVDAGDFARQLMGFCEAELKAGRRRHRGTTGARLQAALGRALARTTARGSSTALVAALDGRVLHAVCVGDSAFLVARGDRVVCRSSPQQRGFNRPYQLGGVDERDPPECAQRLEVEVEPGDVIVAGTDGLFDNLFDHEILDVLALAQEDGRGDPGEMACEVAFAAVEAYEGEQVTPFTLASQDAGLPSRIGGKTDDVTVVVARVR